MANDIGTITTVNGCSTEWNTMPGTGANKPSLPSGAGSKSPGNTRPPRPPSGPIPMPWPSASKSG